MDKISKRWRSNTFVKTLMSHTSIATAKIAKLNFVPDSILGQLLGGKHPVVRIGECVAPDRLLYPFKHLVELIRVPTIDVRCDPVEIDILGERNHVTRIRYPAAVQLHRQQHLLRRDLDGNSPLTARNRNRFCVCCHLVSTLLIRPTLICNLLVVRECRDYERIEVTVECEDVIDLQRFHVFGNDTIGK